MFKPRRRAAIGITAATAALSIIATAAPAQAVVVPAWPSGGRVPAGCSSTDFNFIDSTHWQYIYTDTSFPKLVSATFSNNATNTTVLPPAGAAIKVTLKTTETCGGGLANAEYLLKRNGALAFDAFIPPVTTDAFSQTFQRTETVLPSGAGIYYFMTERVWRRYETFTLDQDFKFVSSTGTGTQVFVADAFTKVPYYVLTATTMTNALSAAKVKKGRTVKATAVLKYATDTGYAADAGDKVYVQTKVGTGKWVTNAALTTNASGAVAYTFVVNATTSVRFVHNKVLSGKFTNAVISPVKVVTKI